MLFFIVVLIKQHVYTMVKKKYVTLIVVKTFYSYFVLQYIKSCTMIVKLDLGNS